MAVTETRSCHCCGEDYPLDGKHAIERFGNVLCKDCSDEPVVFEADCQNEFCDWSHSVEGNEFNRGHLKTRIQQEKNQHVKWKRVFDGDPMHNVEIGEVKR